MKLKLFLPFLLALIVKLNAQVSLPYYVDFENQEGFADEDPLSNSSDWTATDTSIVTADDVAQSGTQSVRITSANPENIISLAFDPTGNSILFVDYYMQLTASALPGLPSFTQPETTAIIAVQPYLTDSGEWVFLDGDGAGSGTWLTAGETMPLDGSDRTDWHRITLRFDLTSNLWDAYIDDNLLAVNLGFVEALIAGSEAINIYGNSVGVAYMDTFSLATTNPLFIDADLDGISDAFESSNGLNPTIDDRGLDPDLDGLTNVEEYAYETDPSVFNADEGVLNEILYNRTNWYIDAVNGNDATGNGSQAFPMQSLSALLAINTADPGYVGTGDTVYLAAGNYGTGSDTIAIAGLILEGALDVNGESLTQINNLEVTADNVTVKNLNFNSTNLELKNVSGAVVTNNIFTESTGVSLSLLGSSNNTISYNRFESAQYHSVMLSWDSAVEAASNDNQFIRNYFTHRTSATTNESIYCTYSVGNNNSLNSRNRFIECAFEETVSGNLIRVITDEGTWWMTDAAAHPYQYSVRFEDCYFKRADRAAAFSEFVITAGWPNLAWRWDELANDTWVSLNNEYAITGDYNDWNLEPRIQFVDSDGNGSIVEIGHNAGLLVPGNNAPEITSAAIISVDEGSLYSYTIAATDMDAGDVVTLSTPQLPTWLSFDGTTLSGTPTAAEIGSHTVEIVAADTSGATDTQLFSLTVNAAVATVPVNLEYVSILFDQDYAYNYTGSVSGTVRGLGSDYADYSVEIISNTDFPYLIDAVDVNADGSWSIAYVGAGQKIARLYSKADTEAVIAEVYGEGLNNPSGSPDNYVPHNDAPGLDAIPSPITVAENAGEQTFVLTGIHDGDHGTQTISISAVSGNPGLIANPLVTYDSANSPETATLSFMPQTNTSGTATITLTLQDDGGTEIVGGTTIWRRVAGEDTKTVGFEVIVGSGESTPTITDRTVWYVDAVNGNDASGIGSEAEPFSSLAAVLSLNANHPGFVGTGDTIYLAQGQYDPSLIEIDIAGLSIEGTLDIVGQPLSRIGNLKVTAADVTLKNLEFHNTELTLQGATGAEITNNVFSGSVSTSLSLIGASNNVISNNHFSSAVHQCVYIYWDEATGQSSDDNLFLSNYFTHRPSDVTNQIVYCNWTAANADSICARNRFVDCAFEETVSGQLGKVVYDGSTWWMVEDNEYSLRFEDCYFKRADRLAAFSQFDIVEVADDPDSEWFWDELPNDEWVAPDYEQAITGDHNNWAHPPRVQFVDADENDSVVETDHASGLLKPEVDNYAPVVENPIAIISVGKDAESDTIDLHDVFEDVETADEDLAFSIENANAAFVTSELTGGILTLGYANTSSTTMITITATDDHSESPKSVSTEFSVTIFVDEDGDGLNDEFEQSIIDFDPADEITSLEDVLPEADFDNDGQSNQLEALNNTDPANSADNTNDLSVPNYSLIDLGEKLLPYKLGNKGHVLMRRDLNTYSDWYYRRWYWGDSIDFAGKDYDSNIFQPYYVFNDMNNHGEIAGTYVSGPRDFTTHIELCGPWQIPNPFRTENIYKKPVIIENNGNPVFITPPPDTQGYSVDGNYYTITNINDAGDYLIFSLTRVISYGGKMLFDHENLGSFLHESKSGNYNNIMKPYVRVVDHFPGDCYLHFQHKGIVDHLFPYRKSGPKSNYKYNNKRFLTGKVGKRQNWTSFSNWSPTHESVYLFAGSLQNEVDYYISDLNQNNLTIGRYGESFNEPAYLFEGTTRYDIPNTIGTYKFNQLSSPQETEALMLLARHHLAVQKQDPNTGDFVPLSNGSDAYTITTANQILHEPDADGNPTQNAEWSSPTFSLISDNGNFIAGNAMKNGVSHAVLWVKMDMAVDNNRDGQIEFGKSDQTTEDQPYRFWINDDSDSSEVGESLNGTSDSNDTVISTKRDLEDFTRLSVTVNSIQKQLKNGTVELGFKWKDGQGSPSLKLYLSAMADGSKLYVEDESDAVLQLDAKYKTALGTIGGSGVTWMDKEVFENIDPEGAMHFLFEGVSEGKGQLVMMLKIGGTESEGPGEWIQLLSVEKMYQTVNATPTGGFSSPAQNSETAPAYPGFGYSVESGFEAAWDEEQNSTVFIHGWRMAVDESRLFAETMFKRLWWEGYKGRYTYFHWPTLTSDYSFSESELRAWKYGASLKSFLDAGVPADYRKNVVAHSLGNVVVAGAIKRGASMDTYVAMQAAIPAGCYDMSSSDDFFEDKVTPDLANPDLGYRGYMANTSIDVINYYNPGDYALVDGTTGLFFVNIDTNWRAWQLNNKPRSYSLGSVFDGYLEYIYDPDLPQSERLYLFRDRPDAAYDDKRLRHITDIEESVSLLASSKSAALGATAISQNVLENRNLGGDSFNNFTASSFDHSGQFNRPIQSLAEFYFILMDDIDG